MSDERGVLRRIAWRELFPWLVLLRTFRMAISPSVLLLATLGVFVSSIGWRLAPYVFFTESGRAEAQIPAKFWATGALPAEASLASRVPYSVSKYLPTEANAVREVFLGLSEPVARLLSYRISINETAYYLFGFLWSLAVWAFVGGAITRRAVVQVGLEDTPGLVETLTFAARRWHWYFLAPLWPALGIALLVILIAPLGLIMQADVGVLLAGLVWLFVLLAGLAAVWLLIGTLFGWPLMWGAISAEREGDHFEAFSRSFSYVYGKPLQYLFYVVVAAILGALGLTLVDRAAEFLIEFGYWAASWGASGERIRAIRDALTAFAVTGQAETSSLRAGLALLYFWHGLVHTFVYGFAHAFFWCSAGAIYLLLRYDVDEQEMDEIYLPEQEPPPTPQPAQPSPTAAPGNQSQQDIAAEE